MYFDYPLEQGLRRRMRYPASPISWYFDYPLEQGLRQPLGCLCVCSQRLYFDYPLEQGLRLRASASNPVVTRILIIH